MSDAAAPNPAPNPADAQIRPFFPASGDLGQVLQILRAAMPADPIPEARFARQILLDPNLRSEGMLVATIGGEVVGFVLALARQVSLENAPSDADRGYITLLAVHPYVQRKGIGSKLLAAAEAYLRSQARSVVMVSSYAPGYFIPGVDVNAYAPALEFFTKKHGYAEVYRPLAMEAPLWSLAWPKWVIDKAKDLTIIHFKPDWALPLLTFTQREFPGDWVRVVRETSARILQGDSPNRLFIAIQHGKIVGFSHYENERFGPIGVAASSRGRGVGQVLMYATLHAQRDAGFRVAWFLWSDDKTAARLYTGAGFKETRRFALLKKSL